jgi:hypothetical protein
MTAKRDLKRRVRHRQVRTGEAYVTARRHVLAARPATQAEAEAEPEADAETETNDDETAVGLEEVTPAGAEPPSADANEAGAATAIPTQSADDADTARTLGSSVTFTFRGAPGGSRGDDAEAGSIATAALGRTATDDAADPTAAVRNTTSQRSGPSESSGSAGTDDAETGSAAARRDAGVAASGGAVPVVELVDVSGEACRANILCRVSMFPSLLARVDATVVLTRLRDLLLATAEDPPMHVFAQVALTGRGPTQPPRLARVPNYDAVQRFLRRARAGLGGVSDDGLTLAFHVAGPDGLIAIQCGLHWPLRLEQAKGPSFVLLGIDDMMIETEALREQLLIERAGGARAGGARASVIADMIALRRPPPGPQVPTLYVIHGGRRHAITQDEFLIGRKGATVHLAINDGMVSRHHAAVIRRDGKYYLRDIGSANGIMYKGMRIDNKRIDEGDVFQIGDRVLAFTFRDDD